MIKLVSLNWSEIGTEKKGRGGERGERGERGVK